jgi:hypothetical protein
MIIGSQGVIDRTKKELLRYSKCEDRGELQEYMGNNLTRFRNWGLKLTHNMLMQSFKDRYDISDKRWSASVASGTL